MIWKLVDLKIENFFFKVNNLNSAKGKVLGSLIGFQAPFLFRWIF